MILIVELFTEEVTVLWDLNNGNAAFRRSFWLLS